MVLKDAGGFAHCHDNPELAVGVVVGGDFGTPQEEIIGAPSETRMQLVIDSCGEGRSEYLARLERLVGRKLSVDVVAQVVVPLLTEMEGQVARDPEYECRGEDNNGALKRHSGFR